MSDLRQVIAAVADAVMDERDELNRLDGIAGDGDMGVTMGLAMGAVRDVLADTSIIDTLKLLQKLGSQVSREAPSTSGTLLATAFLRAAKPAAEGTGSATATLAAAVAASTKGILDRGKAQPGDKTLLDALVPASVVLDAAAEKDLPISEALSEAAIAAAQGAEATKDMRAKQGRAGWLADRSQGSVDAGAHLVAVMLAAAARATA